MLKLVRLGMICVMLAFGFGGALAFAAEKVGQIVAVSGEVTLNENKAASFAKLRVGDVVRLGEKSSLKLVYFASEREESWSGPGAFRVGKEKGEGENGLSPEVSQAEAPKAKLEGGASDSLVKGGVFQVRGAKKKEPSQP